MAGYRRVNYYELCRLCTSSEGTKMHIFREEGRRRQLPTKIQICLPLQVCEDDSLPKIICSHCVDKLESFYDFRESCVNAEAMLESYFTSLRYSDDFTREGKVYVKDESPQKKKNNDNEIKQHNKVALTTAADGLNSLVQAAGIQIVSDAEGTRVQQYKCSAMQMQSGSAASSVVEAAAAEARYTYEVCPATTSARDSSGNNANQVILQTAKVEDGSTQCSETDFNNKQQSPQSSEESDGASHQQTVAFTTTGSAPEMLLQLNFTKDREAFLRNEDHVAQIQRSSIAQIGEFLRMKSVNIVDSGVPGTALVEVAGTIRNPCERCGKAFTTLEEYQGHVCAQVNDSAGEKGGGGNFACEVCGKPFKRKEHLFQHRKLHTGERPYICNVCSKAFSRKEHLVRHGVSHTGQKLHSCDVCAKSFSRKDNLHKHRKIHGIAGPYVCNTCGKSFVVKHYYLMHRGTHAVEAGNTNGNTNSNSTNGRTSDNGGGNSSNGVTANNVAEESAMEQVTNQLPYKCDICDKSFAVKQYLATHKLRHRTKNANMQLQVQQQQQQQNPLQIDCVNDSPHPVALTTNNVSPLTTINTAALLAPNIMHHVQNTTVAGPNGTAPTTMIQISSAAATAYLCTPATVSTNELLETYRRMHSSV